MIFRHYITGSGCRMDMECFTVAHSECAFYSRLLLRTEDCSVPVVIPWSNLTMYGALYLCARRSVLICHDVLAATN